MAAVLAAASAAVTAYWLLGGTAGLDTVGGEVERQARERSAGALAGLGLVLVLKLVAAGLAIGLLRGTPRRAVSGLALLAGGVLTLYGGLLVVVGALVLAGVGSPPSDEYALRWHVCFWDLWFLVWGLALAFAAVKARRRKRESPADAGLS